MSLVLVLVLALELELELEKMQLTLLMILLVPPSPECFFFEESVADAAIEAVAVRETYRKDVDGAGG